VIALRVRLATLARSSWAHVAAVLVLSAIVAVIPIVDPRSFNLQRIAFYLLWYAILATAWNMIGGYAGQISFGHSAFLGMGAYTTGVLWFSAHWDPLLTMPVAGLIAAGYSVLVGAPTLRLRGPFFAIATIGVGEATRLLAVNVDDIIGIKLTHGVTGLSLANYDPVTVHYATVVVFALAMITTIAIRAGRFGLGLFAINMDRDAAETAGVPTARLQVIALAISAFFCGAAGSLYAARLSYLDPSTMFSFNISISLVLIPVVGGIGTIWGPLFGAILFSTVQDRITSLVQNPFVPTLIYGVLLVVIVMFEPLGIAGLVSRLGIAGRKLVLPRGTEGDT
jgi:branched-chain amino acid transport system permease protein